VTTACAPASLFVPDLTSASVRITQMSGFTFTALPQGLAGVTDQPSYTPPANGCGSISGIPTEAGVFAATVNILVDVLVWPFSLSCGGFSIPQSDQLVSEARELIILPDPSFLPPTDTLCVTDEPFALVSTGTAGGVFSGPGVVNNTFDPTVAGVGTHLVKYVVSAQQGAAIAPATDSLEVNFVVGDCTVDCEAFAGTLTRVGPPERCRDPQGNTIEATPNGDAVVPPGHVLRYIFSNGLTPVVRAILEEPSVTFTDPFTLVHLTPFVYDPSTLDLAFVEFGSTTVIDIQSLIAEQGICASLDHEAGGIFFMVEDCCEAFAGTLGGLDFIPCLGPDGTVVLPGIPGGDAVVPPGYQVTYLLTQGTELTIVATGPGPSFVVEEIGVHTLHTLVHDPATLDPSQIALGSTTAAEVSAQLVQNGGPICASLDMIGASYEVLNCDPPCTADAGSMTADAPVFCLDALNGTAVVSATADGNAQVPDGFGTSYLLVLSPGQVVVGLNGTPVFTVPEAGPYAIHTMVFDPAVVDPGQIELGSTTLGDLEALLVQGGGQICGALDMQGASFLVENCTGSSAAMEPALRLVPNPNPGQFAVQTPVGGRMGLEILDLAGRRVLSRDIDMVANNLVEVDLVSLLAPGLYVVRMELASERWEQRMVVQQ
jgi:hypothetical protein